MLDATPTVVADHQLDVIANSVQLDHQMIRCTVLSRIGDRFACHHARVAERIEVRELQVAHLHNRTLSGATQSPVSTGPVSTTSKFDPEIAFSWLRSSSFQPALGAPWKNQFDPLSATISP